MSYTLVYSGNKTIAVMDESSVIVGNVTLPGKNFTSYGQPVDQNFLSMIENFASSPTGPVQPIAGQIWYDLVNSTMKFNTSTNSASPLWLEVATAGANASPVFGNITVIGTATTSNITTGAINFPGAITGNWTLTAGSRLQATYADLAERHHSDASYPTGTVITVGGINDVTAATDGSNVLGVVSNSYAYLMNSTAGDDVTHPAVAYVGRVVVRVVGKINKHDRIVATGNGQARAQTDAAEQSFGWALETNLDSDEKLVLCIIK